MAKINARGAREVARWEALMTWPADAFNNRESTVRYLVVLTSDGRVLRRLADGNLSSGYTVLAKFKKTGDEAMPLDQRIARVERHMAKLGYNAARQAVRV